ncbi:hypothetical protein HanIR_Chr12g0581691 [Helianthus annuus]|nr:hypothetical protein HanIR_Chr12g0581691 [Helianthus annuus]
MTNYNNIHNTRTFVCVWMKECDLRVFNRVLKCLIMRLYMILCMETVYFGLILIYRYSENNGWLLELDGRFSGSIMEYWKHTHKLEGQNMKNGKFGSNRRH